MYRIHLGMRTDFDGVLSLSLEAVEYDEGRNRGQSCGLGTSPKNKRE